MFRKVLLVVVVAVSVLLLLTNSSTHAALVKSETPGGSNQADLFSPVGNLDDVNEELAHLMDNLVDQHYTYGLSTAIDWTGPTDDDPEGATATNFRDMLKDSRAVLKVISHGNNNVLLVEAYKTEGKRHAAYTNYIDSGAFTGDQITEVTFHDATLPPPYIAYGIAITATGISNSYVDANTIVDVDACYSLSLNDDFTGAREYFGYSGCPASFAPMKDDSALLWDRMNGTAASGNDRAAKEAYNAGGFSAGFQYGHLGLMDTVLSPAVQSTTPPVAPVATFAVPTPVAGTVEFDTKMDTTVDPASVITVTGCNAVIQNPVWSPPYSLNFTLQLNTPGTATLIVHSGAAHAGTDFENNLDGNQNPAGTNHVGPNGDDFVWQVKCTACGDGQIDPGEQCDPPAVFSAQCPTNSYCNAFLWCDARYVGKCTNQCLCEYPQDRFICSCNVELCGAECATDADCPGKLLCSGPPFCECSVGGIAELPALAGPSAGEAGAPAEGSGWSAGNYAVAAGGLAAAVMAITVGAWYARRRWLR